MKKKLGCSLCGQKFTMAAHLGRHMRALHGVTLTGAPVGSGKKKSKMRKGGGARVAPVSAIEDISGNVAAGLTALCSQLMAQRTRIDQQLAALENAMLTISGTFTDAASARNGQRSAGTAGRRRSASKKKGGGKGQSGGYRPGSLNDYILRVLRSAGKSMSIAEIESAVLKSGYKTKSKKLVNAINNTMGKLKGAKRVDRGVYRAA